jgi:peroxiredoxin
MRQIKAILLDILAGAAAIGFLIAGTVYTSMKFHLRWLFIASAVLFLLAGFIRGRHPPGALWLKALLVSLAGILVTVVLMVIVEDWGTKLIYASLALTFAVFAYGGLQARRNWAVGARMRGFSLLVLPLGLLALSAAVLMPHVTSALFNHRVDQSAPVFSFTTLDGKVVTSSDLKGHVAVLGFWATWCPPCPEELAKLSAIRARYINDPRVEFWAVDVNWDGETPAKAGELARRLRLQLPLAYDSQGAARALNVRYLPGLVILDREGHIRLVHTGYDASDPLAADVTTRIDALKEAEGKSQR